MPSCMRSATSASSAAPRTSKSWWSALLIWATRRSPSPTNVRSRAWYGLMWRRKSTGSSCCRVQSFWCRRLVLFVWWCCRTTRRAGVTCASSSPQPGRRATPLKKAATAWPWAKPIFRFWLIVKCCCHPCRMQSMQRRYAPMLTGPEVFLAQAAGCL